MSRDDRSAVPARLTLPEVAHTLKIPLEQVRAAVQRRELKVVKVSTTFVECDEVDRYAARVGIEQGIPTPSWKSEAGWSDLMVPPVVVCALLALLLWAAIFAYVFVRSIG